MLSTRCPGRHRGLRWGRCRSWATRGRDAQLPLTSQPGPQGALVTGQSDLLSFPLSRILAGLAGWVLGSKVRLPGEVSHHPPKRSLQFCSSCSLPHSQQAADSHRGGTRSKQTVLCGSSCSQLEFIAKQAPGLSCLGRQSTALSRGKPNPGHLYLGTSSPSQITPSQPPNPDLPP